jgi:PTS system beta-glucosides-specific IIC component
MKHVYQGGYEMAYDWTASARRLLKGVGGEQNVINMTHCATRIRLQLKDESKVDEAALRADPKVITTVSAGGQYQIVVGNDVPLLYDAIIGISNIGSAEATGSADSADASDGNEPAGKQQNLAMRFIAMISSIFLPIIWVLSGTGLVSALLLILVKLNVLGTTSQTYIILHAIGDSVLYFLPVFLAATSAKRFKSNQFVAMAIACALIYPSVITLASAKSVHFIGIPVAIVNYTYTVIPIIITIWAASKLEHVLNKYLPSNLRNFLSPMLVVLITVPLVLLTIGPLSSWCAEGLANGLEWLWSKAPIVGGLILGAAWQPLVVFGIHWGVWPVIINDIALNGFSHLSAPLLPAVFGMCGAVLGVFLKTKNKHLKELAGPATITGVFAGITEPAIYGVTLPLRRPFIYAVIGGGVGGAIAAAGGGGTTAFALPGGLTIPVYIGVGNFSLEMIGTGVAAVIAFILTLTVGFKDIPEDSAASVAAEAGTDADHVGDAQADASLAAAPAVASATATATQTATETKVIAVGAPATGTVVALQNIADQIFASGALGQGAGVNPSDGRVVAPVSGTVITAMPHAFGIQTDDGVEVLVHIGIDTVKLNGEGFQSAATQGQRVEAGDLLSTVDLAHIAQAGFDTTVITVVTNSQQFVDVVPTDAATVNAGEPLLSVVA